MPCLPVTNGVKNHERLTNEQYQKYFDNFNPDLFNPKDWARMAKEAGMKYVVITANITRASVSGIQIH